MKKNHHVNVTSVVPSSASSASASPLAATATTTVPVPMHVRAGGSDGGGGGSAMGLVGGLVDAMLSRPTPPLPPSAEVQAPPSGGGLPRHQHQHQQKLQKQVDFIGPANAVKDLFSLPYSIDAGVSVALHNLGDGTLLLDAADEGLATATDADDGRRQSQRQSQRRGRRRPRPTSSEVHSAPHPPPPVRQDSNEAMTIVNSMLQQRSSLGSAGPGGDDESQGENGMLFRSDDNNPVRPPECYAENAGVPAPSEPRQYLHWKFHEMSLCVASDAMIYRNNNAPAAAQDEGGAPEQQPVGGADDSPRQSKYAMSQALTVRVADAEDLRSKLRLHRDRMERGASRATGVFAPPPPPDYDHHRRQQEQKQFYPSYADALLSENPSAEDSDDDEKEGAVEDKGDAAAAASSASSASATVESADSTLPDLAQVKLHTCILPTTTGAKLSPELREVGYTSAPKPPPPPPASSSADAAAPNSKQAPLDAAAAAEGCSVASFASSVPTTSTSSSSASPVCTVLDAYLDNIMANVPQLALCLREKGFIQSVKLLRTEDIPTYMMNSATLGMDNEATTAASSPPGGSGGGGSGGVTDGGISHSPAAATATAAATGEPLFSPHMVDMNATMLLRFLKANCSRDNATYLLRRNPGEANIQLYDITSISTQRQKKWIWWLAMMSYRFALRLGQLSGSVVPEEDKAMKRSFRARQRSLFQNSLELLEELSDMDGGRHETICAAVNEHLADTFLWNDSRGEGTGKQEERSETKYRAKKVGQGENSFLSGPNPSPPAQPIPTTSPLQPYGNVTTDALNKAQSHLLNGIRKLSPLLEKERDAERDRKTQANERKQRRRRKERSSKGARVIVHNGDSSSSSSDDEDQDEDISFPATPEIEAISMQLHGLLHKLINVSLRLAGHHLRNYWSSSAMQELRTAARKIADAVGLLRPLGLLFVGERASPSPFLQSLRYQYAWLWEYCGHFARSFASDELWRERGHACGDDIVSLLQDVETACCFLSPHSLETLGEDSSLWIGSLADHQARAALIASKSKGLVSLCALSPLVAAPVDFEPLGMKESSEHRSSGHKDSGARPGAVEMAHTILENQKQMKRDERLVLVAASICYSRAVATFIKLLSDQTSSDGIDASDVPQKKGSDVIATPTSTADYVINPAVSSNVDVGPLSRDSSILSLLRQRLGDTCNEIGKTLLAEVRNILETPFEASDVSKERLQATGPLLLSAKFWFNEGLRQFDECKDLRNIALLRCNLCQCCKMRANANVALPKLAEGSDSATHAEVCLKQAADHLQAAHEMLNDRDADSLTWDMVSTELAATLLVLGVRRRQSLLGSGTTPVVIQALRLNPGKERGIVEPIEKAVKIYTTLGNAHQAAAADYQLALFYSKVWTCQRDETKTREKLSAAFKHFGAAHQYFYSAMNGNEPTFVILSLDFSNLYSAVSGQKQCAEKALMCCIDSCDAFAPDAIRAASKRQALGPASADSKEWFEKMSALAAAVEERVFRLLLNLVKIEKESADGTELYKRMYRDALMAKMAAKKSEKNPTKEEFAVDPESCSFDIHGLLKALKAEQKKN